MYRYNRRPMGFRNYGRSFPRGRPRSMAGGVRGFSRYGRSRFGSGGYRGGYNRGITRRLSVAGRRW